MSPISPKTEKNANLLFGGLPKFSKIFPDEVSPAETENSLDANNVNKTILSSGSPGNLLDKLSLSTQSTILLTPLLIPVREPTLN